VNSTQILQKLNFKGSRNIIKQDQDANDIINAMLNAHTQYKNDYDLISDQFYAGNTTATAKKIYNFLDQTIQYKVEGVNNQRIMSPAAIVSLKQNDCKNYALFIVGVLDSLRRKGKLKNKSFFRFVSYNMLDPTPHHTFAVLIDDYGDEIWIDPVLKKFNKKKQYFHKIDKMPLYQIAGIGKVKKEKKPKKIVLKIALAPARGAFLLLVGLNFMGTATKLAAAFKNKKDATNNFWSNLGGNTNELLRKVEQGAKKKRILGTEQEYMGVVATTTAAAAAAPILVKLASFLKTLGIDTTDIANSGKKVIANAVRKKLDVSDEKKNIAQQLQTSEISQGVSILERGQVATKKPNYLPYIIGAGVLYYIAKR
jgi:hypothetical protein